MNQNTNNYLAEERIGKLLLKFSIPCIMSLLVSSLYNIVDQIFIGRGVGCFNRSGLFSALFGPTCRLRRADRVCAQPGLMRGNRGARVAKAGGIVNRTMSKLQAFLFLL